MHAHAYFRLLHIPTCLETHAGVQRWSLAKAHEQAITRLKVSTNGRRHSKTRAWHQRPCTRICIVWELSVQSADTHAYFDARMRTRSCAH
eukprot:2720990-Pleurochrysis_carterae.AAC.3